VAKRDNDDEKPKDRDGKNGKLDRKTYESKLRDLQVELCRLQDWVKHTL
jgi:hypothetical protein